MVPIGYQSPSTAKTPVRPEQFEEAYGCFPAVVSFLLGGSAVMLITVTGSSGHGWAVSTGIGVDVACLALAWRMAIAAVRSPRGLWLGIVAVVAVAILTVATACGIVLGFR